MTRATADFGYYTGPAEPTAPAAFGSLYYQQPNGPLHAYKDEGWVVISTINGEPAKFSHVPVTTAS